MNSISKILVILSLPLILNACGGGGGGGAAGGGVGTGTVTNVHRLLEQIIRTT